MPTIEVQTANGVVTRAVVGLQSVQLGPARVENLRATVNPAMQIGLLGGEFFNNFIYRVNAAEGVIHLLPNEGIRGGMAADQWRNRFRRLRDPLARLERYLEQEEGLRQAERARLERRREELRSGLSQLDLEANRMDVPQRWRY